MNFSKDILLVDFEGKNDPAQVGAVLLDKVSLEEKDAFSSYIYADLQGKTLKKSGITQTILEGAPSQAEVGEIIYEKFGTDIFLGSWVANLDMKQFEKIITAAGISCWDSYDYHILDIWPLAYVHLLNQGYSGAVDSESMFQAFSEKPRGLHNALEDCRIAANVLRKVLLQYSQ